MGLSGATHGHRGGEGGDYPPAESFSEIYYQEIFGIKSRKIRT